MTTEPRTRKVLMAVELMEQWATLDHYGNRLTWNWGEPDADGFYTPTITVDYGDNLGDEAARKERERIAAETHRAYRIVERAAHMGGCSETHHEHLTADAQRVLVALDAVLAAITDTGEGSAS